MCGERREQCPQETKGTRLKKVKHQEDIKRGVLREACSSLAGIKDSTVTYYGGNWYCNLFVISGNALRVVPKRYGSGFHGTPDASSGEHPTRASTGLRLSLSRLARSFTRFPIVSTGTLILCSGFVEMIELEGEEGASTASIHLSRHTKLAEDHISARNVVPRDLATLHRLVRRHSSYLHRTVIM